MAQAIEALDEVDRAAGTSSAGRRVALPLVTIVGVALIAIIGALLTPSATGGVNAEVEMLSSTTSGWLGAVGRWLPLGFAFGAGMVSAVNPCGFSLLPAYLGLFLRDPSAVAAPGARARLTRALVVGSAVTVGFVVLFAVIGIAISVGAQGLVSAFPWIGLTIGAGAIAVGGLLLGGRRVYARFGEVWGAKIGGGDPTLRNFVLFGVSYGTASLSCTLPIFLAVVGGSVAAADLLPRLGQFLLYGFGMGLVIMALTVSIALFQSTLIGPLRRLMRWVEPLGAAFLLIAGGYIVYYWLTLGGLLDEIA